MLNADLHKLKPKELIARRVKSAKEDLRQLFDNASLKQRVEHTRSPSGSVSAEIASPRRATLSREVEIPSVSLDNVALLGEASSVGIEPLAGSRCPYMDRRSKRSSKKIKVEAERRDEGGAATPSDFGTSSSLDNVSLKHCLEPARPPDGCIEFTSSRTASDSGISSSLDSSVSLAVSVPTPLDEKDEDDEDHIHRLTAIAQSWLDFERLFSQSRSRFDQTIEEARRNFCQALVQSLSDHSSVASPLQFSSDLADLPSFDPVSSSPGYSPAPSFTTWTNQTTITCPQFESSVLNGKPNQLPEFSDEELQREFDKFSFHSSQDEEWTSEVESRKQNAINRALLDMKRKLAFPVPRLSSYFSDDSLADIAAQQTFVNPPPSCSSVSCKGDDNDSSYSADKEDETEDNDKSVSLSTTPPDSPVGAPLPVVDDAAVPACPAKLCLSSQMDDPTPNEKQADPEFGAEHIDDGIENVSEALAPYVPRFLTCIPEESLADEYENEPITEPPALSFRRPGSQYRKISSFTRQCTSILDPIYEVDSAPTAPLAEGTGPSEVALSDAGTSAATTDAENENSSPVANTGKTLRRVGNFVDLRVSHCDIAVFISDGLWPDPGYTCDGVKYVVDRVDMRDGVCA